MSNKAEVKLDVWGALERQGQLQDNLFLIIKHEKNITNIARRIGVRRKQIYLWLNGGYPRLPLITDIINQWAEQLREQLPASQSPSRQ